MSYIKLEIGGKERGIKFNQLAMQEFSLNYQRNALLAAKSPDLFLLYNTFHAGLSGNCIARNEEPDFAFTDVIDWVDEMYDNGRDKDIKNVTACLATTRIWKDAMALVAPEEKKSKAKK